MCNKFSIAISSITRRLFARRSTRHFTLYHPLPQPKELTSKSISFLFSNNFYSFSFQLSLPPGGASCGSSRERELTKNGDEKIAKIVVWISISLFEIKSILNGGGKKSFLIFWFVFPFSSQFFTRWWWQCHSTISGFHYKMFTKCQ